MKLLWGRLESWLKKNAPEVLDDLNPWASESEVLELETALGFNLPEDLKESLRIHNGQAGNSQWLIAG
jgi:cell wall assembly regulator SMI1